MGLNPVGKNITTKQVKSSSQNKKKCHQARNRSLNESIPWEIKKFHISFLIYTTENNDIFTSYFHNIFYSNFYFSIYLHHITHLILSHNCLSFLLFSFFTIEIISHSKPIPTTANSLVPLGTHQSTLQYSIKNQHLGMLKVEHNSFTLLHHKVWPLV